MQRHSLVSFCQHTARSAPTRGAAQPQVGANPDYSITKFVKRL